MLSKFRSLMVLLGVALVTACGGGGGDEDAFRSPTTPANGGSGGPVVASVTVLASTPTIASDGATPVEISAFVRDASNNFVENVLVTFNASSGGIQVTQATTDANGLAKATLTTAGDPTNRTITVTASANNVTGTASVNVTGSRLTLQGPTSLVLGQQASYMVSLLDSGNGPIAGETLTVSSQRSNTLSATSLTTDANGQATFNLTIANNGNDTITVSGLGLTATQAVAVNSDVFGFTVPAADNSEVTLGALQQLTVQWTSGGAAVAGQTINFATTRGTLSAASAITNGFGEATVNISSNSAGGATVTASAGGASAQRTVEFVATTPATVDVQASTFTVAPTEQSTLTAIVRDAIGNLVKNQTVTFSLQDVTGGTLSVASAVTDSQGSAQTVYRAGTVTSARDGVVVTAAVQGTAIQDTVALTVARRELFISLGTGNTISEINADTQYQVDFAIQVTDASGNGVPNVPLTVSIVSDQYVKGQRVAAVAPATGWGTQANAVCADEDLDRDGQLDAGEDINGSTRIEAGNIAAVNPSNATTDSNGFALVHVTYPQEYAFYVYVTLEARASVQGTEFIRSSSFLLPGAADDFNSTTEAPPGPISPFGTAGSCNNPN